MPGVLLPVLDGAMLLFTVLLVVVAAAPDPPSNNTNPNNNTTFSKNVSDFPPAIPNAQPLKPSSGCRAVVAFDAPQGSYSRFNLTAYAGTSSPETIVAIANSNSTDSVIARINTDASSMQIVTTSSALASASNFGSFNQSSPLIRAVAYETESGAIYALVGEMLWRIDVGGVVVPFCRDPRFDDPAVHLDVDESRLIVSTPFCIMTVPLDSVWGGWMNVILLAGDCSGRNVSTTNWTVGGEMSTSMLPRLSTATVALDSGTLVYYSKQARGLVMVDANGLNATLLYTSNLTFDAIAVDGTRHAVALFTDGSCDFVYVKIESVHLHRISVRHVNVSDDAYSCRQPILAAGAGAMSGGDFLLWRQTRPFSALRIRTCDPFGTETEESEDERGEKLKLIAIAATVVVIGILAIVGVSVGTFCVLRYRRQRAKRTQHHPHRDVRDAEPFSGPSGVMSPAEVQLESTSITSVSRSWSSRRSYVYSAVENGEYTRGRVLGRGASGTVYEVMLRDGTAVAMKVVNLHLSDPVYLKRQIAKIQAEATIVESLHHPNLVECYAIITDTEEYCVQLFMELAPGGSVTDLVNSLPTRMSEATAKRFAAQILAGVNHMHAAGIVHRDLKCDNIMYDPSTGRVKLGDFGTARWVGNEANSSRAAITVTGTPYFMAPEVLTSSDWIDDDQGLGTGYGSKADIWSFGITMLEMLNGGTVPWPRFPNMAVAFMHIASPQGRPIIAAHLSPQCVDFIESCTQREPRARPTAAQLLQHPWLACPDDDAAQQQP